MSRFQKIFLGSALVVIGFGVAKFMGQPVLPTHLLSTRSAPPARAPEVVQSAATTSGGSQGGRIRLLPDSPTTHAAVPVKEPATAISERAHLGNTVAPVLASNDKAMNSEPRNFDVGPISSAPIGEFTSSGARLRNEAPRPVGIDPRSPAVIRRLPSETNDLNDAYKVSDAKPSGQTWSAPPLLNAGYIESGALQPLAAPASYTTPASPVSNNQFAGQVAPPPWPVREEPAESRTHIVVDGDSLERLAGRYLSDPQRSREIYELNRELLSAPDLLPIGAELKIPERLASVAADRHGFQPNSSNTRPSSAAGRTDITPIQPAWGQGIIPRAQLAPPVMVQ